MSIDPNQQLSKLLSTQKVSLYLGEESNLLLLLHYLVFVSIIFYHWHYCHLISDYYCPFSSLFYVACYWDQLYLPSIFNIQLKDLQCMYFFFGQVLPKKQWSLKILLLIEYIIFNMQIKNRRTALMYALSIAFVIFIYVGMSVQIEN